MRQARNYGAVNETHRQVDEERNPGPEAPSQETVSRQPRSYGAVHQTQWQLDERQNPSAGMPERPAIVRSWTEYGGMVPQQGSANDWIKQNREIGMSDSGKSGAGRGGEGTQSTPPDRRQNDPDLQQARAAVEEARRREAAERARMQERERGGPER